MKPILTNTIRKNLIGFLIRNMIFDYFKNVPITRLLYHSDFTDYMKERWMVNYSNNENFDVDELCGDWLIDIHDYVNSPEFNLKKFKETYPEELI